MGFVLETYDLVPGSLPGIERALAPALAGPIDAGELLGSFRTEFGPLNRIVQLRRVDGSPARSPARPPGAGWPAESLAAIAASTADRFESLPFSPPVPRGELGPWFELRLYEAADESDLERMIEAWRVTLPTRLELGPLAALGRSPAGGARRFAHLWPYRSLDGRAELRRRVREEGIWPPPLVARRLGLPAWRLVRQESQLLVASPFSPLR